MTPDAFAALVAEEYPRLVRATALVCGSTETAEDAVQDALVKAWRALERGEAMRSIPAWTMRVALNETRSQFRRRSAERRAMDRRVQQREPSSVQIEDAVLDQASIRSMLWSLPRRQLEVVVLHYLLDVPVDEVAEICGITSGAVKNALFNARVALRGEEAAR